MKSGIYKITNPIGLVYVGCSKNLNTRLKAYEKYNCKGQRKLYDSLIQYKFENHKIDIIEFCEISMLKERERHYQDLYNSTGIKGLNTVLTVGKNSANKEYLKIEHKSDFIKNLAFKLEIEKESVRNYLEQDNIPVKHKSRIEKALKIQSDLDEEIKKITVIAFEKV